jgi:hypothetical protein
MDSMDFLGALHKIPCHDDCQLLGGNLRSGLGRGVIREDVPEREYDRTKETGSSIPYFLSCDGAIVVLISIILLDTWIEHL